MGQYPTQYFKSPIDSPLYLSGNFCTIRNDHFHYGIDITTYEKEGMPVKAVADGYVSRIKVSPYGYGKVIYIDHPNGYTSVYAHLSRFDSIYQQAITDTQILYRQFAVEFFPSPGSWPVKQGQIIALSGNSGGSSGPHIHFEIRDTKSEDIINPVLFGIPVPDTIPPEITHLVLYRFQGGKGIGELIINTDSAENDTFLVPAGTYYSGGIMRDYTIFRAIPFAPLTTEISFDKKNIYSLKFERFHFDESRQVNLYIDYATYMDYGIRYQQFFKQPGNNLRFYKNDAPENGMFTIDSGKVYPYSITMSDAAGHISFFSVYFTGTTHKSETIDRVKWQYTFPGSFNGRVEISPQYSLIIPAGSLHDSLFCNISANQKGVQITAFPYPFLKPCTLVYKLPEINYKKNAKKLLWAKKDLKGRIISIPGGFDSQGKLLGYIYNPVNAFIVSDVDKPVIKPINFIKRKRVINDLIAFTIQDKLSGVQTFNLYINKQWVPAEYDAKNMLLYYLQPSIQSMENMDLKVEVTDRCGNQTIWQQKLNVTKKRKKRNG